MDPRIRIRRYRTKMSRIPNTGCGLMRYSQSTYFERNQLWTGLNWSQDERAVAGRVPLHRLLRQRGGGHLGPTHLQELQRYIQCCGSGMFIPDRGSEFFPSWIPDPGSKRFLVPHPHKWMKYFDPKNCSKLLEMWFKMLIPYPWFGSWWFFYLEPGIKFFCLFLFEGVHLHHFSKIKSPKEVTKQ